MRICVCGAVGERSGRARRRAERHSRRPRRRQLYLRRAPCAPDVAPGLLLLLVGSPLTHPCYRDWTPLSHTSKGLGFRLQHLHEGLGGRASLHICDRLGLGSAILRWLHVGDLTLRSSQASEPSRSSARPSPGSTFTSAPAALDAPLVIGADKGRRYGDKGRRCARGKSGGVGP